MEYEIGITGRHLVAAGDFKLHMVVVWCPVIGAAICWVWGGGVSGRMSFPSSSQIVPETRELSINITYLG